jgi:hypothetical protein
MSFREARLSLQLLAEEEIGAPLDAAATAKRAAEDAAWSKATR